MRSTSWALHLGHEVGLLVEVVARDERRAGLLVGGVEEPGGLAGAALDQRLAPRRGELGHAVGDERNAPLALERLCRNADPHRWPGAV